jgi:isopenicillin N synthase-like dioxygenase
MARPDHIDSSMLTIIVSRGGAGLQVFDQLAEHCVDINTPCGQAVVLVGHMVEKASGCAHRAVQYRVVSPSGMPRLSLVLKLQLNGGTWLPEVQSTAGEVIQALQ